MSRSRATLPRLVREPGSVSFPKLSFAERLMSPAHTNSTGGVPTRQSRFRFDADDQAAAEARVPICRQLASACNA